MQCVAGNSQTFRSFADAIVVLLQPVSNELFFNEEERQVLKDNTFSFKSKRYEAPAYLYGKKIKIRFDRYDQNTSVAVYYKGERMGLADKVDFIANAQIKRRHK